MQFHATHSSHWRRKWEKRKRKRQSGWSDGRWQAKRNEEKQTHPLFLSSIADSALGPFPVLTYQWMREYSPLVWSRQVERCPPNQAQDTQLHNWRNERRRREHRQGKDRKGSNLSQLCVWVPASLFLLPSSVSLSNRLAILPQAVAWTCNALSFFFSVPPPLSPVSLSLCLSVRLTVLLRAVAWTCNADRSHCDETKQKRSVKKNKSLEKNDEKASPCRTQNNCEGKKTGRGAWDGRETRSSIQANGRERWRWDRKH